MKSSGGHGNKRAPGPLARAFGRGGTVILDGAMGTELERRGIDTGLPLWSAGALMTAPEAVRRIHDDYIDAGAEIITSNTFRTTRRTFARAGLPDRSAELTALAVALARDAIAAQPGRQVLVAGSMAPLEDCYRPDLVPADDALREEHAEHAARLAASGVDFLLLETMGTLREASIAAEAARRTGLEFVVSFLCNGEGALYGGEPLGEAVRIIMKHAPAALALNCIPPGVVERRLDELLSALRGVGGKGNVPLGAYANVGTPGGEHGGVFTRDAGPAAYAHGALSWIRAGASFVGGCCGTTPEYIRAVRGAIG